MHQDLEKSGLGAIYQISQKTNNKELAKWLGKRVRYKLELQNSKEGIEKFGTSILNTTHLVKETQLTYYGNEVLRIYDENDPHQFGRPEDPEHLEIIDEPEISMNSGIPDSITNNWKNQFKKGEQLDFYAYEAEIYQKIVRTKNGKHKIKTFIDIYDENNKLVIKLSTYHFGMEIYEPEQEPNPRWKEQDFNQLTKPINLTRRKISSIYLNNCGTEEWYEFILDRDNDDKLAEICVRRFNMTEFPSKGNKQTKEIFDALRATL